MSPSLPSTEGSSNQGDTAELGLVVVVAPDASLVGRAVPVGSARTLGREDPLFADVSRTLSRRHALVRAVGGGLVVRDLGSRFGTFHNGAQLAASATLEVGDRLLLGKLGFVVRRLDASLGARPPPPHVRLASEVRAALDVGATLHLFGAARTGKRTLVRAVHEAEGLGHVVTIDAPEDLHRLGEPAATLCFANLDDAAPEVVAACAAQLADRARGRAGPRLVVTSLASPDASPPALPGLATAARVRMLALAERPELVLSLAQARIQRASQGERGLTPRLAMHLLGEPASGSIPELEAFVDWLLERDPGGVHDLDLPRDPDDGDPLHVDPSGSSFRVAGAGTVRLSRRPVLCAILDALADASRFGRPLGVDALARAAWPGELMSAESKGARVHTAIATLRRLGLSRHLVRGDDGYRLLRLAPFEDETRAEPDET